MPTPIGAAGGGFPRGIVKSLQPVAITIGSGNFTQTTSINAVDLGYSAILYGGQTFTTTSNAYGEILTGLYFSSSTAIGAGRDNSATSTPQTRGTVIEFHPRAVTQAQSGIVTLASSSLTGTSTITSVDTSRSVLFYCGNLSNSSSANPQQQHCRLELTNGTTITGTRESAGAFIIYGRWCVVEFAPWAIKSIQRRSVNDTSVNTSYTDTISAVDLNNSLIVWGGMSFFNTTITNMLVRGQLTASTTVTLTRNSNTSTSRTANYTVVEFQPGIINTVQRGSTTVSAVTSATSSINTVDTTRAALFWNGYLQTVSVSDQRLTTAHLSSSTQVTGTKNTTTGSSTAGWEVVEFV